MGYACPVCDVPQRDAEHLANHLAFTAMLHGGAHETWLDDHAPDWADGSPADLAPVVAEDAEDATYEEVFEDTVPADRGRPDVTGHGEGGHGHGHSHDHGPGHAPQGGGPSATLDDDARRVLREAREMTQAMLGAGKDESNGAGDDGHGGEDGDGRDGEDGDGRDDRTDRDGKA